MDKFNNNYNDIWNNKIHHYSNFVKLFYESQNLDYKIRISNFTFNRNYELENITYNNFIDRHGEKYILYHSDNKTILLEKHIINNKNNSVNLHNATNIFYDYIKILEKSNEIHLVDSSWAVFIYLLDIKYNIFKDINIYYYPLKYNITFFINNPLLDNWKIVYL